MSIAEISPIEKERAMEALMFLAEKRSGAIKGRLVHNGKPTREWLGQEDSVSPTASLEKLTIEEGQERVIMKITGVLVDILVQLSPETHGPYVVFENGKKVLCVRVIKATHGMLVASLCWYKKFRGELESIGFKFNPYDPCVANRKVRGAQHAARFHVDDLASSHKAPIVNDEFLKWLNEKHGVGAIGTVAIVRWLSLI